MRPTISAIVPVFNGRRYLPQAVESVQLQSLPPAELIVVDDGSTDDSLAALAGLGSGLPLRVLRQSNAGQSAARNRGAEAARGDFLAFLDQDDAWHPQHLQTLAAALAGRPEAGWAYSDFDEMDSNGNLVTHRFLAEHGLQHPKTSLYACVAADLMVLPSASLLRKSAFSAVGGFDEALSGYEDDDLFVRVFRAGWTHVYVPQALVRFRVHGDSSSASERFLASRLRFARKLQGLLPDDRRMRRYYMRDGIAPRFFNSSLDDYVRACAARDWPTARLSYAALRQFAALRQAGARLRWKLSWLRQPRLFHLLVALNDRLPRPLRFVRNPMITLR